MLACAVATIPPVFMYIVMLAVAYFRWGQLPAVNKLFLGFIPAVTAVVVGQTSAQVLFSVLIFTGALYALIRFRMEAVWIISAAGFASWWMFLSFMPRKRDEKNVSP